MPTPSNGVAVNGYALGALRTALGDTRSNVAKVSGVDVSYQSRIESGQRSVVSPEKFAGLARWAASHGIDRRALMAQPVAERLEQAS